jgi:DUF1009 family protein
MAALAILAGGGRLPLLVADSVSKRGGEVHVIAIRGEASPEVERYPHTWVNWGQIGRMLRTIKACGDGHMVIAGRVSRPDLKTLRPDFGLIQNATAISRMIRSGGDNDALTRVIAFFESHGVTIQGVHDVAPELLASPSDASTNITPGIHRDIVLGMRLLATLADLDVGQAVAVAGGRIIAIEGVDGTDRMLARLAAFTSRRPCERHGVLVKAPKAGQELRVDLPTIGPDTVNGAAAAGLSGIAIAAGQVLILDRVEVESRLHELDVALHIVLPSVATSDMVTCSPMDLRQLGRHAPSSTTLVDVQMGVETVKRLLAFGTGAATVVIGGHVLAIADSETLEEFATRVVQLRQWGANRLTSRRGAFVLRIMSDADTNMVHALIPHLTLGNLAGLALIDGRDVAHSLPARLIAKADAAGLFVVDVQPPVPGRKTAP